MVDSKKMDTLFIEAKQDINSLNKAIASLLIGFHNNVIKVGDAFSDEEDVAYCLAALDFLREHLKKSLEEKNKKKGDK